MLGLVRGRLDEARGRVPGARPASARLRVMSAIESRLEQMGLTLPAPLTPPPGVKLPFELVRVHGDLAYISGHGPFDGDRVLLTGSVGTDVTVEEAYAA